MNHRNLFVYIFLIIILFIHLFCRPAYCQNIVNKNADSSFSGIILKGKVLATGSNNAIPYVSIGIPSAGCGTVSDKNGNFFLQVDGKLAGSVIRISSLGYQSKTFIVKQLATILSGQPAISLDEQFNPLTEVTIKAKEIRLKTVGNTSRSKNFNVGFPIKDLGSELGVKIALGKKKVLLRSFNFNISIIRLDSGTFRLNIYNLKDGLPDKNLLTQNILVGIGSKPGTYKVDLTPYDLLMNNEIFISLEWIDGRTSSAHCAVFFSAGLLANTYIRKATEANWISFKGFGAGFNLQVQELE